MYIQHQDEFNIVSFVNGFQLGTKNKCDFTQLIRERLSKKYKIQYSNDGWPGQITRLSQKNLTSWTITFKKVGLEIIFGEVMTNKQSNQIIKSRLEELLKQINLTDDVWFNDHWRNEWSSFCATKDNWFKKIWTAKQLKIIKAIDILIMSIKFPLDKTSDTYQKLLNLKTHYDSLSTRNGT